MELGIQSEEARRERIAGDLLEIIQHMTSDWEVDFSGTLDEQTCLMDDLGFESIDIVMLIVAIEERFQQKGLPFEELIMVDGRYVEGLRIGQIASFLDRHLTQASEIAR